MIAGKAFSFGHPSIDYVIDKTLSGSADSSDSGDSGSAVIADAAGVKVQQVQALQQQQKHVTQMLSSERELQHHLHAYPFWWQRPITSCRMNDLYYTMERLDALYEMLMNRSVALQEESMAIPPAESTQSVSQRQEPGESSAARNATPVSA